MSEKLLQDGVPLPAWVSLDEHEYADGLNEIRNSLVNSIGASVSGLRGSYAALSAVPALVALLDRAAGALDMEGGADDLVRDIRGALDALPPT